MDPQEERELGFGVEGDDEGDDALLSAEPRTLAHELAAAAIEMLPGGSIVNVLLEHAQRRSWEIATQLVDRAADPAGYKELLRRVETNDEVAALFRQAVDAATRTGDEQKRQMLGRLVSAAVLDDAKVDESTVFVLMLRGLDGPHLRALEAIRRGAEDAYSELQDRQQRGEEVDRKRFARINSSHIQECLGDASPTSLLPGLTREGLLKTLQDKTSGVDPTSSRYVANDATRWRDYTISQLGRRFLDFVKDPAVG